MLEHVLDLARLVREQTDGKRSHEAGRLAYSARENIRLVGRKQSLAEGREWIDPFQAPALAGARPLPQAVGGNPPGRRAQGCFSSTSESRSLFCALWGIAPAFGSNVDVDTFAWWMIGCGVDWLVMAVLQVKVVEKGIRVLLAP